MQELLTLVILLVISIGPIAYLHYRALKIIETQSRILASKNYSEYSISESRMAKAKSGAEPDPSYDSAWQEDT